MKTKFKLIVCFLLACVFSTMLNVFLLKTSNNPVLFAEENTEIVDWGKKVDASLVKDEFLRIYLNSEAQKLGLTAYYDKMLNLKESIDLSEQKIKSLEGIENFYFDNLVSINLSSNSIATIPQTAFYNMKNLETIDLSNNSLVSLNVTIYAKTIDLSHNLLTSIEITDNHLEYINLNYNKFVDSDYISILEYDSQSQKYSSLSQDKFYITAYFNYMVGNNKLTNAYLGMQYSKVDHIAPKNSAYNYEMFVSYYLYCYNFADVVVGKDENDNLVYSEVKCVVKMLNNLTNEYEIVKVFNPLKVTTYDYFAPVSGIYKIEFLTQKIVNDQIEYENIFELDENFEPVTENDYNNNPVKVVDKRYDSLSLIARPYAALNVYVKIGENLYLISTPEQKGPIDVELYTTIVGEPVTFKYFIDGKGEYEKNGEQIRFEGSKIHFDTSGTHTIKVWVCQNGVESEFKTLLVNVNIPRKMTFSNWFFLIVGILLIVGGTSYYFISKDRKEAKKEINDFEW